MEEVCGGNRVVGPTDPPPPREDRTTVSGKGAGLGSLGGIEFTTLRGKDGIGRWVEGGGGGGGRGVVGGTRSVGGGAHIKS